MANNVGNRMISRDATVTIMHRFTVTDSLAQTVNRYTGFQYGPVKGLKPTVKTGILVNSYTFRKTVTNSAKVSVFIVGFKAFTGFHR